MNFIKIAITTGDQDGIGGEITAKALNKMKPTKKVKIFLWRGPKLAKRYLDIIDSQHSRITVKNWDEALAAVSCERAQIIDICSNFSPPRWIEICAQAGNIGQIDGLVTAPLSKTLIKKSNLTDIGHTDILKRVTKSKNLFMGFIGKYFNVLLATAHIPIGQIKNELTVEKVTKAILAANTLRLTLPHKIAKRPLAIVGLNPHAGEAGLIGKEEKIILQKALLHSNLKNIPCSDPLVPDAAFLKQNWNNYSVFVCMYHDQGLIPFKLIHGQKSGVHLTLGLPFIRTSVDHGTAKNLFNKDKANPSSMFAAINCCISLCKNKVKLN